MFNMYLFYAKPPASFSKTKPSVWTGNHVRDQYASEYEPRYRMEEEDDEDLLWFEDYLDEQYRPDRSYRSSKYLPMEHRQINDYDYDYANVKYNSRRIGRNWRPDNNGFYHLMKSFGPRIQSRSLSTFSNPGATRAEHIPPPASPSVLNKLLMVGC